MPAPERTGRRRGTAARGRLTANESGSDELLSALDLYGLEVATRRQPAARGGVHEGQKGLFD